MKETCDKMLTTMSLICQHLNSVPWTDDFEYICWAYLTGDRKLPLMKQNGDTASPLLGYLKFLKSSAEQINGWTNDITYFEMDRWLILYRNWKKRHLAID